MSDLYANVRLRPTRIALLVRPTDLASVRKFMRCCTALWGGIYNPIIPVFRTPPSEWRPTHPERVKGHAIARGYIEFFEPDAYVEAEEGLIEEIGLRDLRGRHTIHPRVIPLSQLLKKQDHRDWSEPSIGLGITEVLRHIYETEQRFQLRDRRPAYLVRKESGSAVAEAIFGVYPTDKASRYISQGYEDVYQPEKVPANAETWRKVFKTQVETPLRTTRYGLDAQRYWHHDLCIYIFDPSKATDVIDLWNLRLEPKPVLPVPIDWLPELAPSVREALLAEFRPVRGNPNGVTHHATVEFGRSISETQRKEATALLSPGMPARALCTKDWRNPIWVRHADDRIHRDSRMQVTAKERHLTLQVQPGDPPTAHFDALSPDFSRRYSGLHLGWVNAVSVRSYGRDSVATVFPFNTFADRWPRLDYSGEHVGVGTEGWVFPQQYGQSTETVQLHTHEDVIISSLKRLGVEARLSDEGHVAKQVLEHLGGLWGTNLLADIETLQLLNKMAGGLRRRNNGSGDEAEELFDRRSESLRAWQGLISKRAEKRQLPRLSLEEFTKRNVIRLGLETPCPHCKARNWHTLTAVDYAVTCERCLKTYAFPQAQLEKHNGNWRYRVIGPFSVPDYARGSYGALLALKVLSQFGASHDAMTFSTAMTMAVDGENAEADFVALRAQDRMDVHAPPELVIGEAKSLGDGDLIKDKDLAKLRLLATKLPGIAIVVSVMREDFTVSEKKRLVTFAKWARRPNHSGEPSNPLILLAATELFHDFNISSTWKDKKGKHAAFADYDHTRNLRSFAEATQQIYLSLPPYYEARRAQRAKKAARSKVSTTARA
ncbi:MAG: hypothetical protein ACK4M6_01085 [Hyphomonas sp.]